MCIESETIKVLDATEIIKAFECLKAQKSPFSSCRRNIKYVCCSINALSTSFSILILIDTF